MTQVAPLTTRILSFRVYVRSATVWCFVGLCTEDFSLGAVSRSKTKQSLPGCSLGGLNWNSVTTAIIFISILDIAIIASTSKIRVYC